MKKKTVESALGIRTTEDTARHIDELLKSLPSHLQTLRYKSATETDTEVIGDSRTDVSFVSTKAVDRQNEIVEPEGFDLADYQKNPIVLFGHDQNKAIGNCLWIKPEGDGIKAKTKYASRPQDYQGDWLPDYVFALVAQNVLKGKSVGFLPLEDREPTEEERAISPSVERVITRSLLLEYSVVSVPANPAAIVEAVQKGLNLSPLGWKVLGRVKPKAKPKPRINVNVLLADALKSINIDYAAIEEQAIAEILKKWEA